ncbi:MAG: cytochrome c oxidase subunit 3 [Pseudomonadota bacterium]
MASKNPDPSVYYVPEQGWYPVWLAGALCVTVVGLGGWLNDAKAGADGGPGMFMLGFAAACAVLFFWFSKVIAENKAGFNNAQLNRSYVWGMGWFIFSEVMFFAAFFGALFYTRVIITPWLGGEGAKGLTGDYLWPGFDASWPILENPDPARFAGPEKSMAMPSSFGGWLAYLPLWNTIILLTSSVTVHFAHTAVKNREASKIKAWLGVTVALGCIFLALQALEYYEAYAHYGLTLNSGIYGSTFFLLTGFHGFHVTLGTVILLIQWYRSFRGDHLPDDCFGFEASSWYWHFVDVVWVCLFIFVYIL